MPLRPLLPLLLLLGACSRPDAPASTTSSDRAPAPPAPAAAAAKAPVQPAGSALAKPPAPKPARALEPDATAPLRLPGRGEPAALAKRVLHVGDSMVPLVGNYLRPVFEKRGASYAMVSTHSSSTRTWAADDKLDAALKEHAPELVLISLGSNELFDKDLAAIGDAVRAIVERVGDRACLWIAPPAWAKDFGFAEVVRKNASPCRYFDSTKLKFTRQEDGRHPDWSSSYGWARQVYAALGGTDPLPKN